MQKIPTLFYRTSAGDRRVCNEIVPGCEWVVSGEGIATRKFDGSCCMVRDGMLFKRYELRKNADPPEGFEASSEMDPLRMKTQGWVPVGYGPEDKWHREAFTNARFLLPDGTYELCGPKVQGNPERFRIHSLVPHGSVVIDDCPRDFAGLRDFLDTAGIEGIVWYHPDGRMCKIKARDF